jgi:hypothetical protein
MQKGMGYAREKIYSNPEAKKGKEKRKRKLAHISK